MLMSLPDVALAVTAQVCMPPASTSIPSKPSPEPAIPAIKTSPLDGARATSGSSAPPLIALIAVIGLSMAGVGLVVAVGAAYFLLSSSSKVEIAQPTPVEPAAPTATEVLAQFAPPLSSSEEVIARA